MQVFERRLDAIGDAGAHCVLILRGVRDDGGNLVEQFAVGLSSMQLARTSEYLMRLSNSQYKGQGGRKYTVAGPS